MNIVAITGQTVAGTAAKNDWLRAQASAAASAARQPARAPHETGRKQIPISRAASPRTTAATSLPNTQNRPITETARNNGFFQRYGAR